MGVDAQLMARNIIREKYTIQESQKVAPLQDPNANYKYGGEGAFGSFFPERREVISPEQSGIIGYNLADPIIETTPAQYGEPQFDRSYSPLNRSLSSLREVLTGGIGEAIGTTSSALRGLIGGVSDYAVDQYRAGMAGGTLYEDGELKRFDPTVVMAGAPVGIKNAMNAPKGGVSLGAAGGSIPKAPLKIGGSPLSGAPSSPNIPNIGIVRMGPNPEVEAAALDYSQRSGIPYNPVSRYTEINEDLARQTAKEYDLMNHDPQNPEVKRSFDALKRETLDQFESIIARGIKPYFIDGANPYPNSPYEALIDLEQNKRIGVFPTRSGFGSDANFDPKDNPMLEESGYTIGGQPALVNDIFRAVHDVMGHGKSGVGFRAKGEENAYQSHAGMYTPLARRALASETRGQNSLVNYGPDGDFNRTASAEDTIFADQKTGLMPRYSSEAGLIINDDKRQRFYDDLRKGTSGFEGAITDSGKLRIVHRSNRPIERIDPAYYGTGLSKNVRSEQNRSRGNPDWVNRAYYGLPTSKDPYRPERGLGKIQNEVLVEPELIYDIKKDPDKLWAQGDVTLSEKRISEGGYTGYYVNSPSFGKVAAIFDPYDSTKTFMIPMAAGATALSSLRDEEDPSI